MVDRKIAMKLMHDDGRFPVVWGGSVKYSVKISSEFLVIMKLSYFD
jgi:hypothetical protein